MPQIAVLPPETAGAIRHITRNKELLTLDERMQPVPIPEFPEIAHALPADTVCQIMRTTERLCVEGCAVVGGEDQPGVLPVVPGREPLTGLTLRPGV